MIPRSELWSLTKWMAASYVAGLALSLIWWALLDPAGASARGLEFEIPEGTAAAVAAGRPAPFIPDALALGRDRELRITNNDVVEHRVGSWTIKPGEVAVIKTEGESNRVSCTIHPGGSIGLSIDRRPPVTSTLFPAFLVGFPFGLVGWVAALVGKRLNMSSETVTDVVA